jgi:hypothetical protein
MTKYRNEKKLFMGSEIPPTYSRELGFRGRVAPVLHVLYTGLNLQHQKRDRQTDSGDNREKLGYGKVKSMFIGQDLSLVSKYIHCKNETSKYIKHLNFYWYL